MIIVAQLSYTDRCDVPLFIADFSVTMASEAFKGLTPIKRHRLVNGLLKDELGFQGLVMTDWLAK